jgi:hypothetical protein
MSLRRAMAPAEEVMARAPHKISVTAQLAQQLHLSRIDVFDTSVCT